MSKVRTLELFLIRGEHSGMTSITLATKEFVCIYKADEYEDSYERVGLESLSGKPFISIEGGGPLSNSISSHIENITCGMDLYNFCSNLLASKKSCCCRRWRFCCR